MATNGGPFQCQIILWTKTNKENKKSNNSKNNLFFARLQLIH